MFLGTSKTAFKFIQRFAVQQHTGTGEVRVLSVGGLLRDGDRKTPLRGSGVWARVRKVISGKAS